MALRNILKRCISSRFVHRGGGGTIDCKFSIHVQTANRNKHTATDVTQSTDEKTYKIGVIADLDKEGSKTPGKKFEWHSYLKTGYLTRDSKNNYKVSFTATETLVSNLNNKGKGMELSELCMFNGKLYAADDSTGVVFQIVKNDPIPWVILPDGSGLTKRPFKCEWMTTKDGIMYVGSTGKEFTADVTGEILDYNRLFVKCVTADGGVTHHDWTERYLAIRSKLGISFPGYVIHEAVEWSHIKQKWIFLPRRMSNEKYDGDLDERRATNVLVSASSDFSEIDFIRTGGLDVTRGFSSFKFIPETDDNLVIALKSVEVEDVMSTYVTILDVNTGVVVLPDQLIDNNKYEGIEFL